MNTLSTHSAEEGAFAILRRFTRPKKVQEEKCELCSVPLAPVHRHLLEMSTRRVICSCDACALLFQNVSGARFKLIPRDVYVLGDFQLTDAQWESLALPINLAFFFCRTPNGKMTAMYPSPGGATESLLSLDNWATLVKENLALANLEPDVQALLVNRIGAARDFFLAPIDVCYELAGLIRLHWRGFSGGDVVWNEIEKFFARLRANGKPSPNVRLEESHA